MSFNNILAKGISSGVHGAVPSMGVCRRQGMVSNFDPSTAGTLKLWLKAETLPLNDGAQVTTWTDSSGNGNDATATGDACPIYKTNRTPNGLPAVNFSTAGTYLQSDLTQFPLFTLFVVAQAFSYTSDGKANILIGSSNGNTFPMFVSIADGPPKLFSYNGGFIKSTSGLPTNTWQAYGLDSYIGNSNLYINGATQNGPSLSGDPLVGMRIGWDANSGNRQWDGDVVEILLYAGQLSGTIHSALFNYLKSKYALP